MEHSAEDTGSAPASLSLVAVGKDVPRTRAVLAEFKRSPVTDLTLRQARADDVCAWLRMACGPGVAIGSSDSELAALSEEVGGYLADRLMDADAADTFCGLDLDLSRTVLRGPGFHGAQFCGGTVDFSGCLFRDGYSFSQAAFSAGRVLFDGVTFLAARHDAGFSRAIFGGADVSFESAEFRNGWTNFSGTVFSGGNISFNDMVLIDSAMLFTSAKFNGATVLFEYANLRGGKVSLRNCRLTAGRLSFENAKIGMGISFDDASIDGCHVSFDGADVGHISFTDVSLDSGAITLRKSVVNGGNVSFDGMTMRGGEIILDGASIPFGRVNLDKVSFIAGSVSLENIVIEIEGALWLPWARYSARGRIVKDATFDGSAPHDFFTRTARYRPETRIRWGSFRPGPGPGQGQG